MKKLRNILLFAGFGALTLSAQTVRFNLGGGFTNPQYTTGTRLDSGWNATAGIGLHAPVIGIRGEYQYNAMNVNGATLNALGYPDGQMRLHSFTLNPQLELPWTGPVRFYAIGGGGVYHRTVEFTAPIVATFSGYDPFFNIYYTAAAPANQVLSSYSVTKGGVNGGAGLAIGGERVKFYAEWRYHHMYTTPNATTYAPVTFGLQF